MLYRVCVYLLMATLGLRVGKYSVHAPRLPFRNRIDVFWLWKLLGVERDRHIVYLRCEWSYLERAFSCETKTGQNEPTSSGTRREALLQSCERLSYTQRHGFDYNTAPVEVDQEGVALLREGCDEEGGEEEDETPLAGEDAGDPHHGERGERRHAREEGRNAWDGV